MPATKPTAKQIQLALFNELEHGRGHRPVVPNHHFPGWFECDVLSVTKAGFWHEFEIKLTKADFRKDALKSTNYGTRRVPAIRTKYDALRQGKGPSRFTYVVPDGLLKPDDVPDFAGLMVYLTRGARTYVKELKASKQLHSRKLETKQIQSLYRLFYWRYWGLLNQTK